MADQPRKVFWLSLSPPAIPDRVWKIAAVGGLTNFVVFAIVSYALGGDALNGLVRKGTFFLGNHGEHTQVSELTYRLSYLHGITAIIGVVVGGLGAWRLESREDSGFRRWSVPFGRVLVLTVVGVLLAWSLGVPARWGIPGILLLGGLAWVLFARAQRATEPPDDGVV